MPRLALLLFVAAVLCSEPSHAIEPIITEGSNMDPTPAGDGKKPYEMEGRPEERVPLVTFEDCTKWVVESNGAEASLYRTSDQRLYRPYCGKLVYSKKGDESEVLVRVKEPVAIPDPWDCINFWNYGAHWVWGEPSYTRAFGISAVISDADGNLHDISFDQSGNRGMVHKYWFLNHAVLFEDIKRPARFVGFRFRGKNVTDEGECLAVYLGPVYFYQETLEPLTFEPWPETLPFPTREETILPANKEESFTNSARRVDDGYLLEYDGNDCELAYRVVPTPGGLDGVTVIRGKKEIGPCKGGGLEITGGQEWRLVDEVLEDGALATRWNVTAGDTTKEIVFRYRIMQKSLVIDMEETGDSPGIVEQVVLGRAEPVSDPKLFRIPFLNFDYGGAPRLLYSDGLFFFTQFDWYTSNASRLFEGTFPISGASARFNGGAEYTPRTDGARNPMRERLFINVSPDVHEVFPTIPNPPSPMREVQSDRLWCVRGGNDYAGLLAEARRLRAQGMEKVTIRYHEDFWRDGGESYTFRLNAAPEHGGDEAVRNHLSAIKSLGWRVGLYTNYTDFAPVNANWNEDWVMRGPRREWNVSWSRCYAPKPMIAVEQEAKNAPIIQAKFGSNHSYCDVHTAVSPFSRVDYDWRVPGAATFRGTFECFGRLLLNEKVAYKGPVYSEGGNHWWYAGLTDGNYANTTPRVDQQPLFPDFQLLKIHPLQMDAGQANIALTIAYGNIGMLGMKEYYMLQPIQPHYSMRPVRRIAYEHKGKLVDTSQALAVGAHENARLHVEYEGGAKTWVNAGETVWALEAAGRQWRLPQWGHLAMSGDGGTYSYSGLVASGKDGEGSGTRVDVCHGPVSHYLNTGDAYADVEEMCGRGAVALKKEATGWELIADGGFDEFGFDPELLGMGSTAVAVQALAEDGTPLPPPETRWSRGRLHVFPGDVRAFKYRIADGGAPSPEPAECADTSVRSGDTLRVRLPESAGRLSDVPVWCVDGKELPADAKTRGKTLKITAPEEVVAGGRIWLRLPTENGNLWLDFEVSR